MGIFGGKKKANVPDELPDLISDEIEKESVEEINSALGKEKLNDSDEIKSVEKPTEEKVVSKQNVNQDLIDEKKNEEDRRKVQVVNKLIKTVEESSEKEPEYLDYDSGFFDDLEKNISEEMHEVDDLSEWYEKKFSSNDVLDEMKSYWKKQKKAAFLDSLSKDFEEKISIKISKMKALEKDWQKVYFNLMEKEDEIKQAEEDLKELLNEFSKVCKNKKEAVNTNKKNGKEKENKKDE
jgi:hypothetical protein